MSAFRVLHLPAGQNPFPELSGSLRFEGTGKGRQGAVLVKADETGGIPLVRTTTRYGQPAQRFAPVHERLAQQIQDAAGLSLPFNNALVETYTHEYANMASHSDQALDLADDSMIALYSCYRYPEDPPRTLCITPKQVPGEACDIPLTHQSVVLFSLYTNHRHKHRIVLRTARRTPGNQWLGFTFRTSKTHLHWRGDAAHFSDGERLTLASEEQTAAFLALRGRENRESHFTYPRLTCTLSESDLMRPADPPPSV